MKNYIKSVNEYFQSLSVDNYGYGTGNGVFSVKYLPYNDLSTSIGQSEEQKKIGPDSQFQIGDQVIGISVKKRKKISGQIIKIVPNPDANYHRIFVYNFRNKKIIELLADSIEFLEMGDNGNISSNPSGSGEEGTGAGQIFNAGMQVYDAGDSGQGSLQ